MGSSLLKPINSWLDESAKGSKFNFLQPTQVPAVSSFMPSASGIPMLDAAPSNFTGKFMDNGSYVPGGSILRGEGDLSSKFNLGYKAPAVGEVGAGTVGDGGVKPPDMLGKWTKGADIGLKVASVGLGVWNAMEQQKMNKFMRGYYGDQMDLQRSDFANNAKSTNAQIEQRERNRLSAAGFGFDSAENKQGVADAMDKWGVKGTF